VATHPDCDLASHICEGFGRVKELLDKFCCFGKSTEYLPKKRLRFHDEDRVTELPIRRQLRENGKNASKKLNGDPYEKLLLRLLVFRDEDRCYLLRGRR